MFELKCISSIKIFLLDKVDNYYLYNKNNIDRGFILLKTSGV